MKTFKAKNFGVQAPETGSKITPPPLPSGWIWCVKHGGGFDAVTGPCPLCDDRIAQKKPVEPGPGTMSVNKAVIVSREVVFVAGKPYELKQVILVEDGPFAGKRFTQRIRMTP